tara:strand:- start:119 stop:559 length:441 start_codon:yes stop_codon:yes gene_type:complete
MNLGVYVPYAGEHEVMHKALQSINKGLSDGTLEDASIFYDYDGPHTIKADCGFFHGVDMWHFTGTLVTCTVESVARAVNAVNKFKTVFYYGWETVSALDLIGISKANVPVICNNKTSEKEYIRLTGKSPASVVEDFDLDALKEVLK